MFVFNKKDARGNATYERIMAANHKVVNELRSDPRFALNAQMFANMGLKPNDLYREFDNTTVREMHLDEGEAILTRLMPLARPLAIGRTVLANARATGAGNFSQSMSGEVSTAADAVNYDASKCITPVNVTPFKRNWREGEMLSQEMFDDAVVMHAEHVRAHRKGIIGSFMDGHKDADGNFLKEDGADWQGVRADSRVYQYDLTTASIDFSSASATGKEIRDAWIAMAKVRNVDNAVGMPAVYFVSWEIFYNFARLYSDAYGSGSILANLLTVPGTAEIVPSSVLTGNQVLSMVMSSTFIQPVVGMQVSTIAKSRPEWNSPFAFDIVSAIGWNIKNDHGDANKSVMYAAS